MLSTHYLSPSLLNPRGLQVAVVDSTFSLGMSIASPTMSEATASTALAPTAPLPPATINCDSSQHGTPQNGEITFAIDTPESIRNDVVSKDARRRAREVAAELAAASSEGTNLKRSARVAGLSLDGHLTKRMNNISINTDGSNTGLAPAGAPLRCPKNKGGRPRKNTTAKVHKRQTHLRTNRPVQTPVIDDAWCIIFENSPPSFLMEAYVTGSRFYRMLQHTSLWRTARHKTYGLDHPDPPHNMTEYQYADLLSGVGCQAYGCLNRQARTVYWAYQRRWCDKCVIRLTVEESSLAGLVQRYPLILKCLPRGTFDSWQRYSFAGISVGGQGPTWANILPGNNVRYLRSAAVALDNETVELLGLSVQEQDKWWQNKIALRDRILERVQLIENYFDIQKRGKSITAKQVKSSREFFFVTRAAALDPPLAREALNLIPKFHASVAIPKLPCEKMWELLLPKLLESRDEAESIIQLEEESKTDEIKAANEVQKYENLKESRRDNALPVQKAVLAIARKVVDHLKLSIQNQSTAEADFVPLAFRRISDSFRASRAASINGPGTKLLLDDARMVYTCVIAPALNDLDIKPDLLKCPGCKRKDLRSLFDFDRLMGHIHKRHLNHIGSFGHFRVPKAYYPETEAYPWMSITWPKNLPILARHQIATGVWDPNDDSDYQFEIPVDQPDFSRSAFAGRTASEKYGLHPARLVDNIKFVLSKLKTVSLQPEFKTQIALRYATEMFTSIDAVVIGDTELKELQSALVREGYTDVFEEFMCQECHNDNELSRRNKRWAEKPQSLNRLSDHFKATHDIESWPTNMFNFPSDGELWLALIEPDHKEALSVFEDLYPLMS